MLWIEKIFHMILGGLYALLAVALTLVFIPALIGLFVLLLSLCVFNVNFFKIVAIGAFNRAVSTVIFLLGKASASFQLSENLNL